MKNFSDTIGNRTRAVPHPSAPPLARTEQTRIFMDECSC